MWLSGYGLNYMTFLTLLIPRRFLLIKYCIWADLPNYKLHITPLTLWINRKIFRIFDDWLMFQIII